MAVVRVPFTVEPNYAGWRLDRYLQQKIRRLSRERIQRLIAGRLEHEGPGRLKPSTRVVPGMRFALLKEAEPEPEAPLAFGVVHDDGDLVVVDKPAGLPVHPTARYAAHTFTALARERFPGRKVDPAHRLDRETSGLLACGGSPEMTRALKAAFARGRVEKAYLAIALGPPPGGARRGAEAGGGSRRGGPGRPAAGSPAGLPPGASFEVEAPLALTGASAVRVRMHVHEAGQPARTAFEVLGRRRAPDGAPVLLLACRPRTGRQHQIRAHLHHAGLQLVGDKIYGPDETIFDRFTRGALTDGDRERLRLPRHALHAWRLALPHPRTREPVALEAPWPEDLRAFWEGCAPEGTGARRRRAPPAG